MNQNSQNQSILNGAVIVAALGYFVDIYDLVLFSVVRKGSLASLGLTGEEITNQGIFLIDMQMFGMLLGGILWGILGDVRGRLSVLFGSIFLYSFANIANGFVDSIWSYALWRFIAGIGLAGELGAGITLVAEVLPKEKRGYGTMLVATVGLAGAIVAGLIEKYFDWRICYWIGGSLGMMLLALRIGVTESGMFQHAKNSQSTRGNFFLLFANRQRLFKYLRCVLIGLPTWYVIGILVTFSPEFAKELGVKGSVSGGTSIMFAYGGLVMGDLASGLLSQILKSRIKVMASFLALNIVAVLTYLNANEVSTTVIYLMCWFLGFSSGYWVIFVTIAAEQFGTNIRATVTTTVPNFVRGALVPLTLFFQSVKSYFIQQNSSLPMVYGAMIVGAVAMTIAFTSLFGLKETFDEDLNYMEEM
jgi:MFS family permease